LDFIHRQVSQEKQNWGN